jgi:uncharacterized membrane protein affecting hemolysin expression
MSLSYPKKHDILLFLFLLLLGIAGLSSIIIQNYPLLSMNRTPVAAVQGEYLRQTLIKNQPEYSGHLLCPTRNDIT